MQTEVYHNAENNIDLEYYFYKASQPSKVLVVSFPAPFGEMRGGEWGYLVSLRQIKEINVLFPRSNLKYSKSRMTFRNGKPEIENAIVELINLCAKEAGCTKIIAVGSSMGGWCALYYGIKYNYGIISGSPPYRFHGTDDDLLYCMGEKSEKEFQFMNCLLQSTIEEFGSKYTQKCFISWGDGEGAWKNISEGPSMIKDMETAGMKFEYELYPFSDHLTICDLFPSLLKNWLSYYLGMTERPAYNDLFHNPKNKLHVNIDHAYEKIKEILNENKVFLANPSVSVPSYDSWKTYNALRSYVYVRSGWYWGTKENQTIPIDIRGMDMFLDMPHLQGDRNILEFAFQDSLLELSRKDPDVFNWLLDNVSHYFDVKLKIKRSRFLSMSAVQHLNRSLFFMRLHKIIKENKIENKVAEEIPNEIISCLKFIGEVRHQGCPPFWAYRVIQGILCAAVYFKNSKDFSQSLYECSLDVLNAIMEYHFNNDGVCIRGQLYYHAEMVREISKIIDFIDQNNLGIIRQLRKVKRKYELALEFASHISRPDGIISPIGHTSNRHRTNGSLIKRSAANYIKQSSNIAILEDSSSLSYITINGLQNTNSSYKHCDILSFTWFYDGKSIFCDAGGGMGDCEEYASSSISHNAFICDDYDYVIPDYEDYNTIDFISENEKFVRINMSHQLVDGVEMKRDIIWMKPNVLLLIDEGLSNDEHNYTQNFMLEDFEINKISEREIRVSVDIGFAVVIKQYLVEDGMLIQEYRGTTEMKDKKHYRGSLITNWKQLRRGLNLTYTKNGKKKKFITSIECHSLPKNGKIREIGIDKIEIGNNGECKIKLI